MPITELKTCWRVDVQYKGERRRETAASYGEAVTLEERIKYELRTGLKSTRGNNPQEPTLRKLYMLACDDWRKDNSDKQRKNCEAMIDRFFGWDWTADQITSDRIVEMSEALRKDGLTDSTINKKKAAISKLFTMGRRHGITQLKPYFGFAKEDNERIRWLRDEEADRLIFQAQHVSSYLSGLMVFMLDTGLRLGEARRASTFDIVDHAIVVPDTKNGEPRTVPLTKRAEWALQANQNFNKIPEHQLYQLWHKAREAAGLGDDVTPHILRHTCATRLLRAGANIKVVQAWMGHKKIDITLRYVKLTPGMLRDAVNLLEQHIGHGITD